MLTTPSPIVDIAALFPELRELARTSVRLHPRRSDDISFGACSLGAPIHWPEAEPWPECEGEPFVPVLQLTAAVVPELGCPPGTDS